jgi:hypothetical protein
MYLYVNSTTQRCPNSLFKIFLIDDFFHLEQRISPRLFEKIRNGPNVVNRGLGKTDSWEKNLSRQSRRTVLLTTKILTLLKIYR